MSVLFWTQLTSILLVLYLKEYEFSEHLNGHIVSVLTFTYDHRTCRIQGHVSIMWLFKTRIYSSDDTESRHDFIWMLFTLSTQTVRHGKKNSEGCGLTAEVKGDLVF